MSAVLWPFTANLSTHQVAFMVKAPGRRYTNEVEIKLSYVLVKDA